MKDSKESQNNIREVNDPILEQVIGGWEHPPVAKCDKCGSITYDDHKLDHPCSCGGRYSIELS